MDIILKKGTVISDGVREYTIRKNIGRGASASAYMADCRNGRLKYSCILKEYIPYRLDVLRNDDMSVSCKQEEDFQNGMKRFIRSGYIQNEIRGKINMCNQTPPVSNIFESNGTAYIDVVCYDGSSLDELKELSMNEYTEILLAVSKNISAYHNSGCLCLDLKPENIFVLLDTIGKPVTQLVEFIDYDSVRTEEGTDKHLYYTREWAAPEQTDCFSTDKICEASDIYTLGEIAFWIYFGRHSEDSEHRGFSKYDFDSCRNSFRAILKRPSVQKLLTKLFRNTLRPSVSNRFRSVNDVVSILEDLAEETAKKDFVVPVFPHILPDFTGRDEELRSIFESLEKNNLLWLHGTGGIGKSTIIRSFINQKKAEYDVIIYLVYDKDIIRTFSDDKQLKLSTVRKNEYETTEEYFFRKLETLEIICTNKKVLLVIDNFESLITRELSALLQYGWHTVIVSRRKPPENSFASLHIKAIADKNDILKLISLNLRRSVTPVEKPYFDEIIKITEGHTLTLELIARQISAGNIEASDALEIIRENGFSRLSDDKVRNYKDGEEIYDTLSAIISALFNCSSMNDICRTCLKVISLTDHCGLASTLVRDILKLDTKVISKLSAEGWIYDEDVVRVHPVISETVRNWGWPDSENAVEVMKYYKRVIAVYEGMEDFDRIMKIAEDAGEYAELQNKNIITAMYYDMIGSFYDAILGGAYDSDDNEDMEIIEELRNSVSLAVKYALDPDNTEEKELLYNYLLSLASVYIRTWKNEKDKDKAYECIIKAYEISDPYFENYDDCMCSYFMVLAKYFTHIEPDIEKVHECIETAADIAVNTYQTDIEIIDIIHIPAADCFFLFHEYERALSELDKAVLICRKHPYVLQYSDKLAELLRCMLDVYFELEDYKRCALLIREIDEINDRFCNDGIFRAINPYVRQTVSENI